MKKGQLLRVTYLTMPEERNEDNDVAMAEEHFEVGLTGACGGRSTKDGEWFDYENGNERVHWYRATADISERRMRAITSEAETIGIALKLEN